MRSEIGKRFAAGLVTCVSRDRLLEYASVYILSAPILVVAGGFLFSWPKEFAPTAVLLSAEWLFALSCYYALCRFMPAVRAGLVSGGLLCLTYVVGHFVIAEVVLRFGDVHTFSDDYVYILQADEVASAIVSSGGNLLEGWWAYLDLSLAAWSLGGWPYLLGVISAKVAESASDIHSIAISLNGLFLSIIPALLLNYLDDYPVEKRIEFLFWYLLLIGDPIVYAASSRKEIFLQISFIAAYVAVRRLEKGGWYWAWGVIGGLGFLGVGTSRPIYFAILVLLAYASLMEGARKWRLGYCLIGILACVLLFPYLLHLEIREFTVGELINAYWMRSASDIDMGSGWGSRIFSVPLVGPIVYGLLVPFPENPVLAGSFSWEKAIRSLGSISYVGTFIFACVGVSKVRVRESLPREFYFVALTFLLLFFAAVASADDPRYKQPTNFFLAMIGFMVYRGRKETNRPSISDNILRS